MFIIAFAESIQLVPDATLLFHIAVLLLMVMVLRKTLYRPLDRVLDERDRQTSGRLSAAKKVLLETDEKLASYERQMREARAAAYKIIEQERTKALKEREVQLAAAREEIRFVVTREKENLARDAEQARVTLSEAARNNAVKIETNILGRVPR